MSSFLSGLHDVDEALEPSSSFSRRIRPQSDIGALVLSAGLLGRSEDSSMFLQTAFSRRNPRKYKHKKNGCQNSVARKKKDLPLRRRPGSSSPMGRVLDILGAEGLQRSATAGEIASTKTLSDFTDGDEEMLQAPAPVRDTAFKERGRNHESKLPTGDELDVSHLWDSSSKQRRPSSRIEAKQLAESMLKFTKMPRAAATFEEKRSFLSVIASEVSRQCSVICKERGEVIAEVWSQADSLLGSLADGLAVCQADNQRLMECSKEAELAQTNLRMLADTSRTQADTIAREAAEERRLRKEAERAAALLAVRLEDVYQRHRKEMQQAHRELDRLHELKSSAENAVDKAELKSSLLLSQLAAFQGAGLQTMLLTEGNSAILTVWGVGDQARRDVEVTNALRGMQWLHRTQLTSIGEKKQVSFIKFAWVDDAKLAKSVFDAIPEWGSAFAQEFPERFLQVSGFNSDVTSLRIRSYFEQFGVVKSVTIESLTPGTIIVEMEQREQALRALLLSHQRRLYDQVVLTVQFVNENGVKLIQERAQPGAPILSNALMSNTSRSNKVETRTRHLSMQTNALAHTDAEVQTDADAALWEEVQHAFMKLQAISTSIGDVPTEPNHLDDVRDPAVVVAVINALTRQLQRIHNSLKDSQCGEVESDVNLNLSQQNLKSRIDELERLSNTKDSIIADLATLSGPYGGEERQRHSEENQVLPHRIRELQLVLKDERQVLLDLKRLHERQMLYIRLNQQENDRHLKQDNPLLRGGDLRLRQKPELLRLERLQLDHPEAVQQLHQCNQELETEIRELKKIISVIQHHSKKQEQTIYLQKKETLDQRKRVKLLEKEVKIVKEEKERMKKKRSSMNSREKIVKKHTQQSHPASEMAKKEFVKRKAVDPGRQPSVSGTMMQSLEGDVGEGNHQLAVLDASLSMGDRLRSGHEMDKAHAAPFVMKVIASIQRQNHRNLQDFACESEGKMVQEGRERSADGKETQQSNSATLSIAKNNECESQPINTSQTNYEQPKDLRKNTEIRNKSTKDEDIVNGTKSNVKKKQITSSVRCEQIRNPKEASNPEKRPAFAMANQVPGLKASAGVEESTLRQDRPRFLDIIRGQPVQTNMESVGWLLGHIRRIYTKMISSDLIRDRQGVAPRLRFPEFVYSIYTPEEVADAAVVDSTCLSLYVTTTFYAPNFVEVETFRKFLEEEHSWQILESFLKALSYVETNWSKPDEVIHSVQKMPHETFIRALEDLFPNVSKKFRISMQEELSLKLKQSLPNIGHVQQSEQGHELSCSEKYIFLTFVINKESELESVFEERCLQLFRLLKLDSNNSPAVVNNDWISAFSCMFPFKQVNEAATFVREATAPPLTQATLIQKCRKLFILKKDPRVPTFLDSHLDISGAISRSVVECVRRHWNEFRTAPIGFLNSIKFLRMQPGTATELLLAELEDLASHLDASLCSLMAAESLFVYKQILDNLNHLLSFQQDRDSAAESASVVDRELMFAEIIVREGFLHASQHAKDFCILDVDVREYLSSLSSYGKDSLAHVLNQRITEEKKSDLSEGDKRLARTHSGRMHLPHDVRGSKREEAFQSQKSTMKLSERTTGHEVEPQKCSVGNLCSDASLSALPAIVTDTDPRSNLVNAFPDWEKIASAELPLTESMKQLGRTNISISTSNFEGDFLPGISVGMRLKERDSRLSRPPNIAATPSPL